MNLYYLYALFTKAILVYLHYDNDACLSLSNSTVLAAIFFRYDPANHVPLFVPDFWYDSANRIT